MDEGGLGTCEADRNAAISQLLSAQLTGRPGFMQDPVPQVLWPVGQQATVMQFMGPETIIVGTGRILGNNVDLPGCGGCRTSVDLEMDRV